MTETVLIILEQFFLYLPLMLGACISFSLLKVPNLSIEAAYISGAILASKVLAHTHHMPEAASLVLVCCASMIGGLCVGLLATMLNVYGKIPHLLASILTMGLCYGFNLFFLGGSNVSIALFNNPLVTTTLQMHPELMVLGLLGMTVLLVMFVFLKTQLGYSIAVYGNNPGFFQFYGISTAFVVGCGLALSGALAGLSGYLVAQSSGFVDINAGQGLALFCITALILGKVVVRSEKLSSVLLAVMGLAVYCIIQQMLLKVGFNLKYFTAIQALIVVAMLVIKYRGRSARELAGDHLGV